MKRYGEIRSGNAISDCVGRYKRHPYLSNIAEGLVRHSDKEFVQFLFIAMSSAAEAQSHLYIAIDQKYLSQESLDEIYVQAEKTGKIISGLIKYLRVKPKQTRWTK